jgi:anti-anti-sigma factor
MDSSAIGIGTGISTGIGTEIGTEIGVGIEVSYRGHVLVVSGRLDSRSASVLRAALHDAVDSAEGDLELDLSGLEIWDGAGLGVLVGANRKARRAGRQLVLIAVAPRIARLLRATRLDRALVVRTPERYLPLQSRSVDAARLERSSSLTAAGG